MLHCNAFVPTVFAAAEFYLLQRKISPIRTRLAHQPRETSTFQRPVTCWTAERLLFGVAALQEKEFHRASAVYTPM